MIRTVVYPPRKGVPPPAQAQPPDKFPDKLVKYIPAEVVAFYAPVYALFGQSKTWQGVVLGVSLVATLLYFLARADKAQPPRLFFYPLAVFAFFAWAVGTSSVAGDLFDWPKAVGAAAIPTAVLIVPLLDGALTRWLPAWLQK